MSLYESDPGISEDVAFSVISGAFGSSYSCAMIKSFSLEDVRKAASAVAGMSADKVNQAAFCLVRGDIAGAMKLCPGIEHAVDSATFQRRTGAM